MTEMYVTDDTKDTITLITMNGDVKAVYQHESVQKPRGIRVAQSDIVYVVAFNTLHQLDPVSGTFKLLLDEKDGLDSPASLSFSEQEDISYVGSWRSGFLKVYQKQKLYKTPILGHWQFEINVIYCILEVGAAES